MICPVIILNVLTNYEKWFAYPTSPSACVIAQNIQLFGPREGYVTNIIAELLVFPYSITSRVTQKKKIFEDEQFNYKAEVRCDPQVVMGP